jgi:hypothetical protein
MMGAPPSPASVPPPAESAKKRRMRSGGGTEIDFDERGDAIVTEKNRDPSSAGANLPFWVRGKDGSVNGPMSYPDLLRVLERRAQAPVRDISADDRTWLDLGTFANLTGFDYFAPDPAPVRNVTMLGTLEKRSLVAILARLARTRSTGRLVLMETGSGKVQRREIDVVQGAPTFVYSDRAEFQLPTLLVQRGLIPSDVLPEIVHHVTRTQEPFIDAVMRRTGLDVFQHWPALMRDRFIEIFTWRYGKYAFDASAMLRASTPFSASLLTVVSEGVQRGYMRNELISKLERQMSARLAPASERFEAEIAEMQLNRAQDTAVRRLLEGRPLAEVLKKHPADAHMQLIMTYVLTETELLLSPASPPPESL